MNAVARTKAGPQAFSRTLKLVATTEEPRRRAAGSTPGHLDCATCNLREVCLPGGLDRASEPLLDGLVSTRKRVKRGETLYRVGAGFDSLYAVRSGFFKSRVVLEDGRSEERR